MRSHSYALSLFDFRYLKRIDIRPLFTVLFLMGISLIIIASHSLPSSFHDLSEAPFFTHTVKMQLERFLISFICYFFFAALDYHRLREWAWVLYALTLLSLVGLFFSDSIQNVHRWYRIPFINFSFQPSEIAKLAVVVTLSWYLEKKRDCSRRWGVAFFGGIIVGIPFILILKEPDLGSALVLFPIALVIFYFGNVHPLVIRLMSWFGVTVLIIVALFFLKILPHETLRPYATKILKEYQYERLNPVNHHQNAAQTAISLGGFLGSGWRKSEYTAGGWLPFPYTDSVFPAFGEEFGLLGLLFLLSLFYALIYFCFQVTAVAKDHFGRLLSAGISIYLAMHILMNIGMMCGFLPITGVPLILVTYGGSSVLTTMIALGILQSIYSRRFMF